MENVALRAKKRAWLACGQCSFKREGSYQHMVEVRKDHIVGYPNHWETLTLTSLLE